MKLYLAHPFASRKRIRYWELQVEKETGVELVNPFYDTGRSDVLMIDNGNKEKYDLCPKTIVTRDLQVLLGCEDVLAIVDGAVSYGTIMEMVYTKLFGKRLYVICTNKQENHPWLRYHASILFSSFGECALYFKHYMECERKIDKNH